MFNWLWPTDSCLKARAVPSQSPLLPSPKTLFTSFNYTECLRHFPSIPCFYFCLIRHFRKRKRRFGRTGEKTLKVFKRKRSLKSREG